MLFRRFSQIYLSEIAIFSYPILFCGPVGVTHWNFTKIFGVIKLESLGCMARVVSNTNKIIAIAL